MLRKTTLGVLLVGMLVGAGGAGCPGEFGFVVTLPVANQVDSQDFEILADGRLRIRVWFTEAVDMDSLVAGTNVILDTEDVTNADITIAPGATAWSIVITSVDEAGDLLTYDPDGFFTLNLLGSGDNPILNTEGSALDGDYDGTPGGDYETGFVLIG